ncbi:MAG TPA: 16S rRNA (cytosine(1402)-N(4))-methyltransferase, partial [Gemmatimonadaceae bacterium]|nr:16S rRNA (cytosine(1402)-N(4))-methyltransferase [Gemmatimonadaceae bacterium]
MIITICLDAMLVDSAYHAPVLVAEVTGLLSSPRAAGLASVGPTRVLDCTLGGGGHSLALLMAGVETVVGVDRDPDALAAATLRLHEFAEAGRFF